MENKPKICYFTQKHCLPDDSVFNTNGEAYYSKLCGRYRFYVDSNQYKEFFDKQKTACYLYYNRVYQDKCYLLVHFPDMHLGFSSNEKYIVITEKDVENWYPKTFAEKIDKILLKLYELTLYDGDYVNVANIGKYLFFISPGKNSVIINDDKVRTQSQFILCYLKDEGYANVASDNLILTPKALERVYELQKNQVNNKNVFIAMQFGDKTKELREKLKEGVVQAGYHPIIMDEVEHNHQIVPEMLYQIKNSKFVIAELSHHNNGAYYEAGYAFGLGKEVIHICKREELASGLHFDVAQVNTIVYDNIEELPDKIDKRIQATIG